MTSHREALSKLLDRQDFSPDAFSLVRNFGRRPLIVYGAGECSHWFFEIVMKMRGHQPVAVLDRRFRPGDFFEGIPAFSPSDYSPTEDEKRDDIVIICVGVQEHHEEMAATARAMGFQHIISLRDVYDVHNPFELPRELNEKGFAWYRENREEILAALDLFADEASQEVYVRCLETHLTRLPVSLPMRPRPEQYFPKDVPLSRGYQCFVCCGSYDGDSVRLLHKTVGKVDTLVCFEPEPLIYRRLVDYLQINREALATTILALPCAVYSQDDLVPFLSGTGLGSRISPKGESWVQAVALDHVFPSFEPTFICMDVEGVELEVLKGGEQLLRRHRPDLGVCVYHSPDHLWRIPLYLHQLGLGYRLYLRNYTTYVSETVLYASL
jgi:FkbM family methyltransferase